MGILWVFGFVLILTSGDPKKRDDGVVFIIMPFIEVRFLGYIDFPGVLFNIYSTVFIFITLKERSAFQSEQLLSIFYLQDGLH